MAAAGSIRVRFAAADDLDACLQLDDTVDDVIRRKIEASQIIVAQREGDLLGYLRLEYLWSRTPYIGLIRVRSPCRRQGIGRAILAFLEAFLRDQGYKQLLSSSQVDEPAAQAWHRAVGFEECGILSGINEDGIGEVFFRKALTNE